MSEYIVVCTQCKIEKNFKYKSRFIRVNSKFFICSACKKINSAKNRIRICPKCKRETLHSSSGNRKRCEGSLCRPCRSNQIPSVFNEEQLAFFNGLMLGDGGLPFGRKSGVLYPRLGVARQVSDRDYLFWQYNFFKDFYGTEPKYYQNWHNRVEKYYDGYQAITKSGQIFKEQRIKWYPNDKKEVPRDLKLTPLTLLIWFLDDGCVVKSSEKALSIKFSTDGFKKEDVEFLSELLGTFINDKLHVYKNGKGWILKGSTLPTIKIIKIINDIFPDCMERKRTWKDFDFKYFDENPGQYGRNTGKIRIPGNAKLNFEKAENIRKLFSEDNLSNKELAEKFSVSIATINNILANRGWRN